MNTIELRAEPRTTLGKKVGALRRQGIVPANVYGHAPSTAIQIPAREAERVLQRAGRTHLISLHVDGSPTTVLIKDWQRHPYKGSLLHLDFYRVAMTERLRIDVPVRLVGEAPAVKDAGGTLLQALTTVSVESLPADIPESVEVDVSGLAAIDDGIYVRDVASSASFTILTGADELIVKVMAPRVEVEETAAPETVEAAGESPAQAEGEASPPNE